MRWTERKRIIQFVFGLFGVAVLIVLARPFIHLVATVANDVDGRAALPSGHIDDASRLNRTRVTDVWHVPVDSDDLEGQIASLLRAASAAGKRVSIAGARHTMGGHTIYPDGYVIDMLALNKMTLDDDRNRLHVQAGATWKSVIAYLDKHGRSVSIMQSNNSFTVGGTISVNAHGWQYGRPPIASTVESFRFMTPDGSIVRCDRNENSELFSLVLGGYGLFGIILDATLHVVDNEAYHLHQRVIETDDALTAFNELITNYPDIQLLYARMNVMPERFLDDVIIYAFVPAPDAAIPELDEPNLVGFRRSVFRGSAGSDYGKKVRWFAESEVQPLLSERVYSRNRLLNEDVTIFQNRSANSTDILHEYFVPRNRVAGFVDEIREIIPRSGVDLLNVTIRVIDEDHDTVLRYADTSMFAFVMLFTQEFNAAAESQMAALTRELIDVALKYNGRYYLPYRLHATPEQFHRAYPWAEEFFERKRQYDPDELFQNQFYVKYGRSR